MSAAAADKLARDREATLELLRQWTSSEGLAVDELCGFCMACALVQPDKRISSVKTKSVKKKPKQKGFAAKVNRDESITARKISTYSSRS